MGHHIPVLWFRSGIGSCYTSFHICSMYGISTNVGKSPYVELHRSVKVRTRLGQKYGSLTANAFSSRCSACGLPPLQHRLTFPPHLLPRLPLALQKPRTIDCCGFCRGVSSLGAMNRGGRHPANTPYHHVQGGMVVDVVIPQKVASCPFCGCSP